MSVFAKKGLVSGLAIGMACLSVVPLTGHAEKPETPSLSKPNIILIVTDDQKRASFNFLKDGQDENGKGINLTPTMDKMVSEGILFSNMYASSSVCTPSRFSCLTGTYASRAKNKGFTDTTKQYGQAHIVWNTFILASTPNVGRILQQNGYRTGFVGKDHVMDAPSPVKIPKNADPRDPAVKKVLLESQALSVEMVKEKGFDFAASIYPGNVEGHQTLPKTLWQHNQDWITQGAVNFLDECKAHDKPFFLYMATTIEHGPRQTTSYNDDPLATPAGFLDKPLTVQAFRASISARLEAAGLAEDKGNPLWLDDSLSALLKKLEENGELENTIIFFFNDHGVEAGKGSCFEGGVHTQSFVWGKGVKGERVYGGMVENIDFAPTFFELAGVPKEQYAYVDGKSMVTVLEGSEVSMNDSIYCEMGCSRAVIKEGFKYMAVRSPDFLRNMPFADRKEILDARIERQAYNERKPWPVKDPNTPFGHVGRLPGGMFDERAAMAKYPHYFDADQLYDLNNDPNEQVNLADNPEYREKLETLKKEMVRYFNEKDIPGPYGEFKETE